MKINGNQPAFKGNYILEFKDSGQARKVDDAFGDYKARHSIGVLKNPHFFTSKTDGKKVKIQTPYRDYCFLDVSFLRGGIDIARSRGFISEEKHKSLDNRINKGENKSINILI